MKSAAVKEPKDNHITNKDDSVTNKDGNNNMEKGEKPTNQNKPDEKGVPIVIPDNNNVWSLTEYNSSNKEDEPSKENL